jgi:hypothetical protein
MSTDDTDIRLKIDRYYQTYFSHLIADKHLPEVCEQEGDYFYVTHLDAEEKRSKFIALIPPEAYQ